MANKFIDFLKNNSTGGVIAVLILPVTISTWDMFASLLEYGSMFGVYLQMIITYFVYYIIGAFIQSKMRK